MKIEVPAEFEGICDTDNNSNHHHDKRYKRISTNGPFFSHEQITRENGIDQVLKHVFEKAFSHDELKYEEWNGRNKEAQAKLVKYNFWTRSVIEPNKCSLYDGSSKEKLMEEINRSTKFFSPNHGRKPSELSRHTR